jgi:DNA-binding transcriptional ArsR family regulator
MSNPTCCDLDDYLKAMSNETRQRILALLREREMSVDELNAHFAVTQPTISHHLAILRRAHLVSPRRAGRQTFYHANPDCVGECCREILNRFAPLQVGKLAGE